MNEGAVSPVCTETQASHGLGQDCMKICPTSLKHTVLTWDVSQELGRQHKGETQAYAPPISNAAGI